MTIKQIRFASVVMIGLGALAGCTDLEPLRAQVDDLKSQLDDLRADMIKSATANNSANAAASAEAQRSADKANAAAEANAAAIAALNDKIDRMFKRPVPN